MNSIDDPVSTPYQDYEIIRSQLFELSAAFDAAANAYPPLLHQWVWGDEDMRSGDWQALIRANSRADGDWQEWLVIPRGMRCARFYGFEDGLDEYLRLAELGYRLLCRLRDWTKKHGNIPSGLVLNLPKFSGQHGWTLAVYVTARCHATALLSERSEYWGVSGQGTGSEDDSWTTTDVGERYPNHPPYEELVDDVFRSSAEAIRLWLDPDQAVTIGEILEDLQFAIPFSQLASDSAYDQVPNSDIETVRPFFSAAGQLWVGKYLVKQFEKGAPNQRTVLKAFQLQGWCRRIDNPLPDDLEIEIVPSERLGDTVEALNDPKYHIKPGLIKFRRDGTGKGIIWEFGDRAHALLGISPPPG